MFEAPPVPAADATSADVPLHDRVLRSVLVWFALGSLLTGLIAVLQTAGRMLPVSLWVGLIALQGASAFLLVQRRLGFERTALGFLGYLIVIATYFQCFRGLTPGTVLGDVAFVMLSGLFFGTRGVSCACMLLLASLALAASLNMSEVVVPWDESLWDPHSPLVWLRYAVVFAFYGGAVAAGLIHLTSGLARSADQLRETLARERAERAHREELQRKLEHAQRIEALGQLAAGMAHDFNNSLSVIVSGVNVIRTGRDVSADVKELADEVIERASTAADSVRQLLSLAKSNTGEPTRVQLEAVLARALPMLKQAATSRVNVEFTSTSTAFVAVDVSRLQQALLNLALNARDAMPEGGRWSLTVSECDVASLPVGWSARPGKFVVLACSDSGSGIEPTLLDKIFEPFFTTKPHGQGTGLGLAMVRKTIFDVDGFIELESRLGAGTTFRLCLPAQLDVLP